MKEKKRVQSGFEWVPAHERVGRFGFSLGGDKVDDRTPMFRLERDDQELYFVNDTDECLKQVISYTGGSASIDQHGVAVSGNDLVYDDVLPGEAILIDRFCPQLDCDYLLQADVTVHSEKLGEIYFSTYPEKGEVPDSVLLWNTGEKGKKVMGFALNGKSIDRLAMAGLVDYGKL